MKKLRRIWIETVVILLTQVLDIQAGCYWDSTEQTNCGISCFGGFETPEQVLANLDEKWNEVNIKDCFIFNLPVKPVVNLISIISSYVASELPCRWY